ncbi:unnamed protein product (macronuclear) [Paramecium tetraurelia]|uniref:Uncharacterized protein n=1 Tax=Paramecium tetraurelia TaxID=5888 RepID=A0BES8_PARTE|nr:uncharacterized protein GSPATT00028078001 [Paramecium tetraurelia]CAK57045.1 unnamed protein product [Paramecium tetraurelia]|eukprot:XP_001424443.1 hypothetical protein (macronuclear) [Paramecium tetraurelia strain d4-2]
MTEINFLKRKFESLRIVDDEAPKTTKKPFIQDADLYLLGKKIQSIHLVQPLQSMIKKPDIYQTCFLKKENYNPFLYIDRPITKEEDEL